MRVLHVPGAELAAIASRPRLHLHVGAHIRRAGDVVRLKALPVHAQIVVRDVKKPGAARIGGGIPVFRAGRSRADVAYDPVQLRLFLGIDNQAASLEVHALCRIGVGKRLSREHFAAGAIDHIEVGIALRTNQDFARLPVPRHVEQDDLVDAIPVVDVMRRELVKPFCLSGVGIAREYPGRPFVVAGPLLMIPRPRVRGAVIDEVELGII